MDGLARVATRRACCGSWCVWRSVRGDRRMADSLTRTVPRSRRPDACLCWLTKGWPVMHFHFTSFSVFGYHPASEYALESPELLYVLALRRFRQS